MTVFLEISTRPPFQQNLRAFFTLLFFRKNNAHLPSRALHARTYSLNINTYQLDYPNEHFSVPHDFTARAVRARVCTNQVEVESARFQTNESTTTVDSLLLLLPFFPLPSTLLHYLLNRTSSADRTFFKETKKKQRKL